jgi:hypothetical protein
MAFVVFGPTAIANAIIVISAIIAIIRRCIAVLLEE